MGGIVGELDEIPGGKTVAFAVLFFDVIVVEESLIGEILGTLVRRYVGFLRGFKVGRSVDGYRVGKFV